MKRKTRRIGFIYILLAEIGAVEVEVFPKYKIFDYKGWELLVPNTQTVSLTVFIKKSGIEKNYHNFKDRIEIAIIKLKEHIESLH